MDSKISGSQESYHTPAASQSNEEKAVPPPAAGEMRIGSDERAVPVAIARGSINRPISALAAMDLMTSSSRGSSWRPLSKQEVKEVFSQHESVTGHAHDEGTWRNVGGDSDEDDVFEPGAHVLSENSNRLTHRPIAEATSDIEKSDVAKATERLGLITPSSKFNSHSEEDLSELVPKEIEDAVDDYLEDGEGWDVVETEEKPISKKQLELSKQMEEIAPSFISSGRETLPLLGGLKKAVAEIGRSQELLAMTSFDPDHVMKLRGDVQSHRIQLISLRSSLQELPEAQNSTLTPEAGKFKDQLIQELDAQSDRLELKEATLTQYLRSDPFNDKNVLRPRRILAEGVYLLAQEVMSATQQRIDGLSFLIKTVTGRQKTDFEEELRLLPQAIRDLNDLLQPWYAREVAACESADPEARSRSPRFYQKDKTGDNPIVKYDEKYFVSELKRLCETASIPKNAIDSLTKSMLKRSAQKAMNDVFDWNVIVRDMSVSLNGETKHFRQTAEPLSQSLTVVGQEIRDLGVHGIVPATRDDGRAPINARRTTLVEVLRKNDDGTYQTELVHERQQHGIVDHFHLDEPKRTEANKQSAQQLIQYGMEADREFITAQIEKTKTGDATPASVFYINTNLTTPTATPRDLPGKKDTHDERTYSDKQGEAFRACAGQDKAFHVLDPETKEAREIAADVTFIDFRFPVNYALDPVGALDPGMMAGTLLGRSTWDQLHAHNAVEFQKLFGSLRTNAPVSGLIGPALDQLNAISLDGTKSPEERAAAAKMISDIERECHFIRSIFADKSYQSAVDGDRFKMPRHIDLLVNKFREATRLVGDLDTRVINAGGCMSGKDREGVANVEAEAAVMIEKMGGAISPGHHFSDEERNVYNTSMALVVDNTLQVTGYGGSKNAKEVAVERIVDRHAILYAAGLSHKAKT